MEKHYTRFGLTLLLAAAMIATGCSKEDSPVAVKTPAVSAPPLQIDQSFVGTWYQVATLHGIEFKRDGTWQGLYVQGNTLSPRPSNYYDITPGGTYSTAPGGRCILSFTSVESPDTSKYAFSNSDSVLTLVAGEQTSSYQYYGVYIRKAIGEMIVTR